MNQQASPYEGWDGLSREELRKRQGRLLHRLLKSELLPFSNYYRELFEAEGLTANDIHNLDDLARVPLTSKADLLNSEEHPARARDFILQPDQVELARRPGVVFHAITRGRHSARAALEYTYRPVFMISTTGRSSEPVPFFYTRHDLELLSQSGLGLCEVLGAKKEDKILNTFPYAPHLAFWQVHYAMLEFNAFGLSTGGGKVMGTEGNMRLIERIQPNALIGMPTFLYHLLRACVAADIRNPNLRSLVLGGEKVPTGMRRKLTSLARQLGAGEVHVTATYGFTEARMAWAECPAPTGQPSGYHITPGLMVVEIVDPETGEIQPDGAPGEIVVTPLQGRGSMVLRYRTGDCISGGLVYEPCPHCERQVPRLVGDISRRSEVRKIKGTLVDFNQLEHILDNEEDIGTWQLELRKQNDDPLELDELILHVHAEVGDDNVAAREKLESRILKRFSNQTELRPNRIEFHSLPELSRRQGVGKELKEQRLIDNRPGRPSRR